MNHPRKTTVEREHVEYEFTTRSFIQGRKMLSDSLHHYFMEKGENTTAIHQNITKVCGNVMSVKMVCRWHRQFLVGQTDVSSEKRGARPSEININTINTVCFLIKEDWHWSMDEIECYFKEVECNLLSHGTIMKIIHEEMEMKKVCARRILKLLTDVHKANRIAAEIKFLTLYH